MKYTPEEMFQYINDHDMDVAFLAATMNNPLGFSHVHVEGKIIFENNAPFFFHKTADDTWDTVALDPKMFSREAFDAIIKDPTHVYVEVVNIKGHCSITMACYEKENELEQAQETVWKAIALQFIRYAKLNTPGKVKAIIRESDKLIQTYGGVGAFTPIKKKYQD